MNRRTFIKYLMSSSVMSLMPALNSLDINGADEVLREAGGLVIS
jgi:hypothetical protein